MFASAPVPTPLALLLWAGACLGHLTLAVGSYNWWYAQPVPRPIGTLIRLVYAAWMLAFPVLLFWEFGAGLTSAWPGSVAGAWPTLLTIYLALCWVTGFGIFPAITLVRWRRRKPAVLASNHTQTLDIAAQLGYLPAGRSIHRWMARLPGNELFRVDLNEKTLHLPRLPAAWDGLSILHLSDLHFIGIPDRVFYQKVLDACASWDVDLIAMTGDVVDSAFHRRWIVPLLGRLRCRVAAFAILGNHDYWHEPPLIRRRLRRAGMRVLGNGWERIEVNGEPMLVIGHEGPWFKPEPDLSACPQGPFRLCLSHTPDNIAWARRHGIDLMLSGHNHGGQVRLPVIGSVFVPSRFSRRYDCGTFDEPPTVLHVSRGLGAEHPMRYNCRPEVTKLVLRTV